MRTRYRLFRICGFSRLASALHAVLRRIPFASGHPIEQLLIARIRAESL